MIDGQQREVLSEAQSMELRTVPEVIRLQRLARNLEQLRNRGDNILTSVSDAERQDALLMMTMISTHPSIRDTEAVGELAANAANLLAQANLSIRDDPQGIDLWRKRWQPVALALSQAADESMARSGQLLAAQIESMSRVVHDVRFQTALIIALAGLCILLFVWILQVRILRPLLKIHEALRNLQTGLTAPDLPGSRTAEIKAIENMIVALHESQKQSASVQQELAYQASHDSLTGLPNRRIFLQSAGRATLRAITAGRNATVGMIDVDHFKRINDLHGHAAGDEVLRECANIIAHSFRSTDLFCRYGGEEFAFVVLDSDPQECRNLAERLRERVARNRFSLQEGIALGSVTISIGLSPIGATGLEKALSDADAALYLAKAAGRNRTSVWQGSRN